MYRYLLVVLCYIGIAVDLMGQVDSPLAHKAVYLKDGSIIKGEIIEDN